MTLEVEVEQRHVNRLGVQTRTPAEDAFVVLPPQAVVPAHGTQVFRLQSLPAGNNQSQSYFATVHQLPVKMDEIEGGGAQVQMVFAFDVAIHVVPKGVEAKPEIVAAVPSTMIVSDQTKPDSATPKAAQPAQHQVPAVEVTLRNSGNKYLYLQDYEFVATGTDQSGARVDLPHWDQDAVVSAAGVTLVEPGAERVFKLPITGTAALKSVQVDVRERPRL